MLSISYSPSESMSYEVYLTKTDNIKEGKCLQKENVIWSVFETQN